MSTIIPLGRVRGTAVHLRPSALLLGAGFTVAMALLALPLTMPGHTAAGYWLTAGVVGLLLLGSVLAHELGHALAGNALGFPARRITLSWQGGVTEHEGEPRRPRVEFLVTAAGPAATVVLTALCALIAGVGPVLGMSRLPAAGLLLLGAVNGVLAVANLLPGASLDGGQLIAAWLWHRCADRRRGQLLARRIALVLGLALLAAGVIVCWTWNFTAGLAFLVVGWLIAEPRLSPHWWSGPDDLGPWPGEDGLGSVNALPASQGHHGET